MSEVGSIRGREGIPADLRTPLETVGVGSPDDFLLPLMDGGEARGGAMEDRAKFFVSFDAKRRKKIDGDLGETDLAGEGIATGSGELTTGGLARVFALTLAELGFASFDVIELLRRRAIEHLNIWRIVMEGGKKGGPLGQVPPRGPYMALVQRHEGPKDFLTEGPGRRVVAL